MYKIRIIVLKLFIFLKILFVFTFVARSHASFLFTVFINTMLMNVIPVFISLYSAQGNKSFFLRLHSFQI